MIRVQSAKNLLMILLFVLGFSLIQNNSALGEVKLQPAKKVNAPKQATKVELGESKKKSPNSTSLDSASGVKKNDSSMAGNVTRKPASHSGFKRYFSKMLEANGTYLQSTQSYKAAKEQNGGKWGAYIPSLVGTLSKTESFPSNSSATKVAFASAGLGLDYTKILSGSLGLVGHLPALGFSYTIGAYQNSQTSYQYQGSALPFSPSPSNTSSTLISAKLNLLKGFGPSVGTINSESLSISEKASFWKSKSTLIQTSEALLNAYIASLLADKQLSLAETFLKNSEEFMNQYSKLEVAGQASGLAVLNARYQLQTSKGRKLLALDQKANAIESLNRVAGTDDPLDQFGKMEDLPEDLIEVPTGWIKGDFDPKQIKNPDLQILRLGIKQAELEVRSTKNSLLPSLNLTFSQTRNVNGPREAIAQAFENQYWDNTIALELSLPLSASQANGDYEAAKASTNGKKAFLNQSEIDLREKWKSAVRDLFAAEASLKIAEETVSISKQRYESSLPTMALSSSAQKDVIDYQASLQDANIKLLDARTSLLKAKAKLYFLRGDLTLMDKLAGGRFESEIAD